ncbi:unnamed protein product [Lactuca saligna]|uniref:Uncharacterized protein n=1 Tax=Lactuca saligna TaxID=75948 RepID=A0AA35ZGP3_LACSI|nr:unnamed protein product [Lactuca saligna]
MLTSASTKVIEESTKATQASNNKFFEHMDKVLLLQTEVKEFMANFRTSSDKSTEFMNKVIKGFSSLKHEKKAPSKIQADIKLDNVDLNSTITTQLDILKVHLAAENKIMVVLAEQTQKAKALTKKLKNAKSKVARLQ